MFSIFIKNVSEEAVKAHLERISFLMKYLEQHGMKDKKQVVKALNNKLFLAIPSDIVDPENRIWPDPSNTNIAISFACDDHDNVNSVNQFILIGFEAMANTLVIGTAHQKNGGLIDFTWSISNESDARPIPPLSLKVQQEFWKMPGYRQIGLDKFQFLKRV